MLVDSCQGSCGAAENLSSQNLLSQGAALFCCSGALPGWQIFWIWAAEGPGAVAVVGGVPALHAQANIPGLLPVPCSVPSASTTSGTVTSVPRGVRRVWSLFPCGSCPPKAQGQLLQDHPMVRGWQGVLASLIMAWRDLILQPRLSCLGSVEFSSGSVNSPGCCSLKVSHGERKLQFRVSRLVASDQHCWAGGSPWKHCAVFLIPEGFQIKNWNPVLYSTRVSSLLQLDKVQISPNKS